VREILSTHERIDVLVSNDVVPGSWNPVEVGTPDEYRAVIEAGMIWPFSLAHAIVPQMKARSSGVIILITSGSALVPSPNLSMYSSARAGAVALSQSLTKELGSFNVQVNAICPNWFRSETCFFDERLAKDPNLVESIKDVVPIKRLGEQHEMGALVAFLASQKAMPLTGQAIAFAGGFYP
jgi:NAD(P)-dependent dehydrogenase (short-subunit alcohol dehydrogenase family)